MKLKGIAKWQRSLEDVRQGNLYSAEETRGWKHPWASRILEWLRSESDWDTHFSWLNSFSTAERLDMLEEFRFTRRSIYHYYQVGLHESDPDAYRKAVEYLRSYPEGERQTDVQDAPPRYPIGHSSDYYVYGRSFSEHVLPFSASTPTPRSGTELFLNRRIRTLGWYTTDQS